MAFCASCGKQSGSNDRFCQACGAPVATQAQATPAIAHCPACGKPAPPGYDFCEACGNSLRGNVPASTVQQAAPPQQYLPTPASIPTQRKSHLGIWLGAIFLALVVLVVVVIAAASGPKPDDSLDQARTAYIQHDQSNFDKYVDVNSVLSDWTDQGVNVWLKQQNAGPIESAAAQIIAGTLKGVYLPNVAQSVDQLVVTGSLPDQSQSNQNDQTTIFVTAFMSSILHSIATSQLTYQGVQSKSITNDDAELTVGVTSSLSTQPINVRIRMHRVGDHWRVTAVEDLAGLLNQISPTSAP